MLAGAALSLPLAACGGGTRQDASEPSGNFNVDLMAARFPANQSLSQHVHLIITVHNADSRTIPDIAVTITAGDIGTQAQAFAETLNMPGLASRSRPVWIVDRGPGPCAYSCRNGGPGSAVTAYSNTWALGALKPGAVATFDWAVTAVKAGVHVVRYSVARPAAQTMIELAASIFRICSTIANRWRAASSMSNTATPDNRLRPVAKGAPNRMPK